MSGVRNDTIYAKNVDFSGATIASPTMVSNGQLLIGSAVAPNIRTGFLSSSGATIAITTGNGTINLESGGLIPIQFTTDIGAAVPSAGNINVISGLSTINSGYSVNFTGAGSTITLNVTDAGQNTIIGKLAGSSTFLSSGSSSSTALGYNAMHSAQNATNCVAIGFDALKTATFGPQGVVAIGRSSGASITNASGAVMIGSESFSAGNGSNVCIGYQTLKNSLSGNLNICIGYQAAISYTGSESNNILIGHAGVITTDSGVIRIGTAGSQNSTFISGITGVTVASSMVVGVNASGQLSSLGSLPSGVSWAINNASSALISGSGVFVTSGTPAFTIPIGVIGNTIEIALSGGTSWTVNLSTQTIIFGNLTGTVQMHSLQAGDWIRLVCRAPNVWQCSAQQGNPDIT